MLLPLLAGITSFFISFAFLPFIIKFSKKNRIGDAPGRRKIHKKVTPSLGGVAIFFGFTIGCICWADPKQWPEVFLLLPVLIIPFIIGLLDDLIHLKPAAKLIAQSITATLIFFMIDIRLTSFYGLIGDIDFSLPVSYLITLITVILITNSLNLIDGIDGLAAVFSFIATLFFGSWFFFTGDYQNAVLCFALAGGILAFFFQNWEPSKIFMGDTGSLVIGTLLAVFMIQFMNSNHALDDSHTLKFNSSIGTAVCVMIIPLIDTSRIVIIRLYKRISLFTADKRHIHHSLVRLNLSHKQTVYVLALVHVFFLALAVLFRNTGDEYLLPLIFLFSVILCLILEKLLVDFYTRKGNAEDGSTTISG
jgi:UDP-N-acetylmuramyl pentapeptide phosphotransferase/UDP-N-acetylglucosamine-1-phosphate transferase